jgi:hypothetical protein
VVSVKDLGDGVEMAGEVAFGPLRNTATAPGDEHVLGETAVGILDLDEGELDTALAEVFDELGKLAI